ncbi:NUMOD3 domain-containing DNA-binding protein [Pseudoduganella violaceinigra]|uniref:NUMOD3 domain-containing DNA-binding protein n=1 Tax=Pseudoduganella violaceinigra TaxID=246602 RepID=UPI0004823448|nr:NUMOD3 domain-containing DNA-binding protein [Pseudoduganella violaceinigra]
MQLDMLDIRVTVYGLASSKDATIRYVGQTTKVVSERLKEHLTWTRRGRDKSRRTAWIKSVLEAGNELTIISLQDGAELHVDEMKWIQHFTDAGHDLVNGSMGGDGCIGVPKSEEHKEKIRAAMKIRKCPWTSERNRAQKGKPGHAITPETKLKISLANKGKPKKGLAERNMEREWTEEQRQRIRATRTNRKLSDEDVREIRRLLAQGMTQTAVSKIFGVTNGTISEIHRGRTHSLVK